MGPHKQAEWVSPTLESLSGWPWQQAAPIAMSEPTVPTERTTARRASPKVHPRIHPSACQAVSTCRCIPGGDWPRRSQPSGGGPGCGDMVRGLGLGLGDLWVRRCQESDSCVEAECQAEEQQGDWQGGWTRAGGGEGAQGGKGLVTRVGGGHPGLRTVEGWSLTSALPGLSSYCPAWWPGGCLPGIVAMLGRTTGLPRA